MTQRDMHVLNSRLSGGNFTAHLLLT